MLVFAEWLLANLPAFLRLLPKEKLMQLALQLGSRMGVVVEATVPGIMASVRTWVTANPQLALFVANVAVLFGFQIADSMLAKVIDDADDGSSVSKAALAVKERLTRYRATHTGDGVLTTVNGSAPDELGSADESDVVNGMIDVAVRSIGSFDMFMAIRTAMFLEDKELETYRLSRRNKTN